MNVVQTILIVLLAIILTFIGTFFYAKNLGEKQAKGNYDKYLNEYSLTIKDLEIALEREQNNIKVETVTEYVDKVRIVKEKEYVYRDRIKEVPVIRDNLPVEWLRLHDASATGSDYADSPEDSNEASGGVEANIALETVVENYATCERNRQQLLSLQQWVNNTLESYAKEDGSQK